MKKLIIALVAAFSLTAFSHPRPHPGPRMPPPMHHHHHRHHHGGVVWPLVVGPLVPHPMPPPPPPVVVVPPPQRIWINGYYLPNGTYVAGHWEYR